MASGAVECALAVGFEQMKPGALGSIFDDRPSPFDRFESEADDLLQVEGVPLARRYFGGAGLAHMQQYGTRLSTFASIRAKASRHAANNPLPLFRKVVTEEEVLNAPVMWPGVMTRLMACPPTCGGAATIVCSDAFAQRHGLDLCVDGGAEKFVLDGDNTYGGRYVTNPSGGLLSKGHPLGATGLAQCTELV